MPFRSDTLQSLTPKFSGFCCSSSIIRSRRKLLSSSILWISSSSSNLLCELVKIQNFNWVVELHLLFPLNYGTHLLFLLFLIDFLPLLPSACSEWRSMKQSEMAMIVGWRLSTRVPFMSFRELLLFTSMSPALFIGLYLQFRVLSSLCGAILWSGGFWL